MNIDELLSEPLAPVADNGFSARVMARVQRQEQQQLVALGIVAVSTATAGCLLLPLPALTETLNHLVLTLASSVEVGIAAMVAALTWAYDKKLHRAVARFLG